ncbi:MAG: calcium-translocating P-type ATPase, PMCA-type [Nanoarchaeota archaeon]|nr:calcium-translocating P-type ATPase, PMCA-type [Nanoarchaeota archaeon]
MNYHSTRIEELFKQLNTSEKGLTEKEAQLRLKEYGLNEIKDEQKFSALKIFLNQFNNFLIWVLLLSSLILFLISSYSTESRVVDASLILLIVILNSIFGFIQDYKAEKSIKALKKLSTKKTIVIRNNKEREIDTKYIVPGDIIILEEGDYIPSDSRLLEINNLKIDESLLTGESKDIEKSISILKENTILAERKNLLYKGSLVTSGKAKSLVINTGLNTEEGKIVKEIQETKGKQTIFQKEINTLGKKIGFWILLIIIFIFITLNFFSTIGIIDIFITSIALAVAAIPEGLPAVVTLSLALGTRTLAKRKSLIRKLSVVESLGSIDTICVDKTGTITQNIMKVTKLFFNNKTFNIKGKDILYNNKSAKKEVLPLIEASLLTNAAYYNVNYFGDPTEVAILKTSHNIGLKRESLKNYKKIREMLFTSQRKRKTILYGYQNKYYAYMEGALETTLERCSHILINNKTIKLTKETKKQILEKNKEFASQALRVLAFSYKECKRDEKELENNLTFLGLEAMEDPPRKGVKESLNICKEAGIRVMMITGDNLVTAKAIAKQINLQGDALEGGELDDISDSRLKNIIEKYNIFARVTPQHKVKILKALQSNGHIVAMTGDGVNDAPALKNSDVGISMGINGTDVARETSDMVLLDDNFNTIVESVKQGRTIFHNIRKFVNYLLTTNITEVLVIFIISLFGYLPLTAVHLLWINFITDGGPALALGVDPPLKDTMNEKPRKKEEPIINKRMGYLMGSIGIQNTVLIILLFFISLSLWNLKTAQTMVFMGIILYEFVVISSIRHQEKLTFFSNRWLIIAITIAILLQFVILYTPLAELFKLVALNLIQWIILLIGLAISWILAITITKEVVKYT